MPLQNAHSSSTSVLRFCPLDIALNGLGILLFLVFSFELRAQQQYTITNYTQEQGLPTGTIRSINKDTTGYIWLTSEQGVSRFDGYTFKVFRHNPDVSNSLPANTMWWSAFPRYGDIYFGNDKIRSLYQPESSSFTSRFPFGDSIQVFSIDISNKSSDHYLVITKYAILRLSKSGTERFALPFMIEPNQWAPRISTDQQLMLYNESDSENGVLYLNPKTKTISKINVRDGSGMEDSSAISDVVVTGNNFYLFNEHGVHHFDPKLKSFERDFDVKQCKAYYGFSPFTPVNDSIVIILSNSGYLNVFNLNTKTGKRIYVNKKLPEASLHERVLVTCVPDDHGGFWIGTTEMGIIHYNPSSGEMEQYIHDPGNANSLPGNMINIILPEENGIVWASCFGHGLVKMEPVNALFKTASPAASHDSDLFTSGWSQNIRGFVETESGYWIATLNGLFSYSSQTNTFSNLQYLFPEKPENSVIASQFGALAEDHSGNIWIGKWDRKLYVYNKKRKKVFRIPISQPLIDHSNYPVFRNLFCDSKNRMWISTSLGGVSMVECDKLDFENLNQINFSYNFFNEQDSTTISSGTVYVVSEDAEGNIWAGTDNGLCRYREATKTWIRYRNIPGAPNSIHHNDIRSICLDLKGILWIGTNDGGLNRYDKEQDQFTHFTTDNRLPDNHIYSLLCDDNGMLWMGTNHGLCRFNTSDLTSKNFTVKDGIQDYEYNTGAALTLKDGTLLMGGINGFNIIHPDKIQNKNSVPPVVVLSSFKIFEQETPTGDGYMRLDYLKNSFTFEFAALNYYRNQENQYAYKLEGVNDDWISCGTRRYVSFSKLKPGDYTFKVKASNADGVWNEAGTQLRISILPPWWKTWWAYSLYGLLISVIVYIVFSFLKKRLLLEAQLVTEQDEANRLKELDTFKSQLFTNLTHEFRTPLTVILGMARQLARGKEQEVRSKEMEFNSTQLAVGSKQLEEGLKLIENNGKNLLHLINQLLDLSKLENKSFKLQTIQSDIIPYLRYLTESFQSYAENINLALRFITPVESLVMDFDPEQMKQILTNLISNALKFTLPGGEVTVELMQSSGKLEIVVTDTGIGISEKDLPHILERFYQADSSNTRVAQGSGIGLAHTQELLKIMGGNISVESELGKGTRVWVQLPIKHEEIVMDHAEIGLTPILHVPTTGLHNKSLTEDPSSLIKKSSIDASMPQLLIIEDSPDVVVYLKSCLEDAYQIAVAYNGKIGIEKAFEEIPDLIISDVMMPEKDGYEVCDTLKNDDRTSHIPIILLTAKADAVSRMTGLRRGADAYLSKPFDQEELLIQITMLLDNRRRMASYFSKAVQIENGKTPPSNNASLSEAILIEDAFLKKVNTVIEAHYTDENFSLPELSKEIGMSRSQLLRKIKAISDNSPSDLIRTYRLQKAKALLESGDVTVSEATYQVGFKDPSYFSKLFQEEFGVLPRAIKN